MCNTNCTSLMCERADVQVTFGQIKAQEAGESHHGHTGVEVRRGVAEELEHI